MDDKKEHSLIIDIPKMNILLMLFFYGATLTLYEPVWYLCRIKSINSLNSEKKLSTGEPLLLSVFILTQIGYSMIDFGIGAKISWIFSLFFSLLIAFKARNVLAEHLESKVTLSSDVSYVSTFFFRFFYLQYKINRQYDKIFC